jgi:hypothetical protein
MTFGLPVIRLQFHAPESTVLAKAICRMTGLLLSRHVYFRQVNWVKAAALG